jgi:hypothetical protein
LGNLDNLFASYRANPHSSPKNLEVLMKRFFSLLPGLAALAALCLAHAANAAPVGSLSCTTATGDFTFNVSYFTFGLTDTINIGSGSSGAGAGKITVQPLEVHAALSTFSMLIGPTRAGSEIRNCTLTTTMSDGSSTVFEFRPLVVKALTVVAEKSGARDTRIQYTDVQFEYLMVDVKTSGGADDGGSSPDSSTLSRTTNGGDPGAAGPN